MEVTIPISQLRAQMSHVFKRLRENPDLVFKITHHSEVVAELKAPELAPGDQAPASTQQKLTRFIDAYLQGALPRKKGAYQRIRKLCATAADQLPYPSVEEAMQAIRGRAHGAD